MIISAGFSLFELRFRLNWFCIRGRCWNKKGVILLGVLCEGVLYGILRALIELEIAL